MMAIPKKCPEKTTLAEYLLGKLVEPDLGQCEAHVVDCDRCEETMRGLSANDTLSQLTSLSLERSDDPTSEDKRLISNLITQLQDAPRRTVPPQQNLENRAAEVTRLLSAPTSTEMIGTLAHYDVKELIGAGSTGVVYRAFDQQLHRVVALKILRPSLGESSQERFLAEARSAAAISHPNVITIFQVGIEGPLAYMAMEWIPGETLEERLARVTLLSETAVREIGIQIADGLAAANRKSLIHRDIKPANIWMDSEDNRAIILDFGLARIADDNPQMTATGMLAGTPNFMSPEQTRGLELDGRSDLFSLGCLMYRASTGKLPFGSTGILATLQTIQKETPRLPQELNPNLTEDFSDLVMCLLEKQPIDRPETAKQLSAALVEPRVRWPFKATVHAQEVGPVPKSQIKTAPGGSTFFRWVAAAILFIAIGWSGWSFSPQIIRIATNQGELVIDSKDEAVEVEIAKNGEVIRIVDTKTDQHIDIIAGEYDIRVKDPRNGFELKPGQVVMTRGGKQIVTITRKNPSTEGQNAQLGRSPTNNNQNDADAQRHGEFTDEVNIRILDTQQALEQRKLKYGKAHPEVRELENLLELLKSVKTNIENGTNGENPKAHNALPESDSRTVAETDPMSQQALFDIDALELEVKQKRRKVEVRENELSRLRQLHEKKFITKAQLVAEQNQLEDAIDALRSAEDLLAYKKHELTEPRYQGKTFNHWMRILQTERSYGSLVTACVALGMLADGNPTRREEMLVTLTPMIRKYGSKVIAGLHTPPNTYKARHLNDGFVAAIGYVEPERLLDFVIEEIDEGTNESRRFSSLLFARGFIYKGRLDLQTEFIAAMSNRSLEIATDLLDKFDSAGVDEWEEYSDLLSQLTATLWSWQGGLNFNTQPTDSMKETFLEQNALLVKKLKNAFQSEKATVTAAVGPILAYMAPETDGLALQMAKLLSDRSVDLAMRCNAYSALFRIDPEFSKDSVPLLVDLAKRESPEDKLLEQALNRKYVNRGNWRRQRSLPWQIFSLFSKFGTDAEVALPWIHTLTPVGREENKMFRDAIRSIEGADDEDHNIK